MSSWTYLDRRRVAWCIQESQRRAAIGFYLVGTDMLGDASGLTRHNSCIADRIQQRRLTMVNVAHDGNDRRTRLQIFFVVFDLFDDIFDIRR